MKIYGIGTDIANINRIKKSLKNKNFIDRLFSKNEVKKCNNQINKANCYAKRFAAKEAFVKALGEGFRNNINFNDIDVTNDKKGKPVISVSNNIKNFLKKKFKLKKYEIFLSLSDEKKYSIAYVIINKQ